MIKSALTLALVAMLALPQAAGAFERKPKPERQTRPSYAETYEARAPQLVPTPSLRDTEVRDSANANGN